MEIFLLRFLFIADDGFDSYLIIATGMQYLARPSVANKEQPICLLSRIMLVAGLKIFA